MLDILYFAWWFEPYNSDDELWSLPIFWIARLGKIIQFFSGLIIIIEIVGTEKVKKFGDTLHKAVTIKSIADSWIGTKIYIKSNFYLYTTVRDKNGVPIIDYDSEEYNEAFELKCKLHKELLKNNRRSVVNFKLLETTNHIFALFTTLLAILYILNTEPEFSVIPPSIPLILILGLFGYIFVYPFVISLILIAFNLMGLLIDLALVEPIVFVLKLNSVEKRAKKLSAILFFFGFFLEMLAS